jgi:hypothetical protein
MLTTEQFALYYTFLQQLITAARNGVWEGEQEINVVK